MEEHNIFVSTNGSDTNNAGIDSPLRTPGAAQRLAASFPKTDKVNVYFRGGDYHDRLIFHKEDSGSPDNPVTYSAYENEKVRFLGGFRIGAERFSHVTDDTVLTRIIDEEARKRIVKIDLSDNKHNLYPIKFCYDEYNTTALFSGGNIMDLARYPKRNIENGHAWGPYALSLKTGYEGPAIGRSIDIPLDDETADRAKKWHPLAEKDAWVAGYFGFDWFNENGKIVKIDPENKIITTDEHGFIFLPNPNEPRRMRLYYYNILDELGAANEYYADRETGFVYICPDDPNTIPEMYLGTENAPLLEVTDAHDIEIRNIEFSYTHGTVSKISYAENVTIDGCTFAHGASMGILMRKSKKISVLNSCVFDMCKGGIFVLECGNSYNVDLAQILIDNCIIHDVAKVIQCYTPCIKTDSCGVTISHNTLYNSPHQLLLLEHSQNIIIEYNELFNAVADTDDSSVIYWGRVPQTFGMVIHDNYFHDNGNSYATFGNFAIYQDDLTTGADIYNNVFYKTATPKHACVIMGAQFHHAHNNIFISERTDYGYWQGCNGDAFALSCAGAYTPNRHNNFVWGSIMKWNELMEKNGFFGYHWRNYYKGTFWEKAYDILTDEKVYKIKKYRTEITDLPDDLQNAKLRYYGLDVFWSHRLKGGEIYEGSVWDMIKERYPEEYKKAIDETEGKSEADRLHRLCKLEWDLCNTQEIIADYTVYYDSNLTVGVYKEHRIIPGAHNSNNFDMDTHIMPNGKSIFTDFGHDFSLTKEGEEFVKSHIKGFKPIDMTKIGAKRQR